MNIKAKAEIQFQYQREVLRCKDDTVWFSFELLRH